MPRIAPTTFPCVRGVEARPLDPVAAATGDSESLVAINPLAPFVALLRLDRESRDRTRVEAPERDGIAGFDAIAVRTLLDAGESSLDLGDQFPLPVTGAQLDRAVGFRRCAVGEVGVVFAFLLQGGQRVAALGQNRFAPGDQLAAEIFSSVGRS